MMMNALDTPTVDARINAMATSMTREMQRTLNKNQAVNQIVRRRRIYIVALQGELRFPGKARFINFRSCAICGCSRQLSYSSRDFLPGKNAVKLSEMDAEHVVKSNIPLHILLNFRQQKRFCTTITEGYIFKTTSVDVFYTSWFAFVTIKIIHVTSVTLCSCL